MPSRIQIKLFVFLVLSIVAAVLFSRGQSPSLKDLASTSSYAVTGVGLILVLWNRWLWSWWIFRPWLSKRPDLRGTWKGVLHSEYLDPTTHQRKGPIDVYLVIRQTNSDINVRLFSAESSSVSLSGGLISDGVDVSTLVVTYRNEPQLFKREHSPIGYGGMLLNVRGDKVYQLDGEYWTDRLTRGEAKFTTRSKTICHDFGQAAQVTYQGLKTSA